MNKHFLRYSEKDKRYMLWVQTDLLRIHWPFVSIISMDKEVICRFVYYKKDCLKQSYEVIIAYKPFQRPKVVIINPTIKPSHLIHMNIDGTLCLYYPNDYKYDAHENLALEVIPWTIKWICYYELWLVNGHIWKAKEASHGCIRFAS